MKRKDYRKLCDLADNGEHRAVINLDSHAQGKVLSCHHDFFNVRVGKGWEVWDRHVCEASMMANEANGETAPSTDFQI